MSSDAKNGPFTELDSLLDASGARVTMPDHLIPGLVNHLSVWDHVVEHETSAELAERRRMIHQDLSAIGRVIDLALTDIARRVDRDTESSQDPEALLERELNRDLSSLVNRMIMLAERAKSHDRKLLFDALTRSFVLINTCEPKAARDAQSPSNNSAAAPTPSEIAAALAVADETLSSKYAHSRVAAYASEEHERALRVLAAAVRSQAERQNT